MEQGQLFESNVVSLAEFRQRRLPPTVDDRAEGQLFIKPRPLSVRSEAHLARMLAHLSAVANQVR